MLFIGWCADCAGGRTPFRAGGLRADPIVKFLSLLGVRLEERLDPTRKFPIPPHLALLLPVVLWLYWPLCSSAGSWEGDMAGGVASVLGGAGVVRAERAALWVLGCAASGDWGGRAGRAEPGWNWRAGWDWEGSESDRQG